MAVSVRMNPLLEKELELAAQRQGVTKSQFIIDAVERALGRKDPAQIYRRVMAEAPDLRIAEPGPDQVPPASTGDRLHAKLQAQRQAQLRDWLAYQEARRKGEVWVPADEGEAP